MHFYKIFKYYKAFNWEILENLKEWEGTVSHKKYIV